MSRPVWGAWIEMETSSTARKQTAKSRPVWGAWIEMGYQYSDLHLTVSRAPYGARGLKYHQPVASQYRQQSRPVWGAWIEIQVLEQSAHSSHVAPRMGRVD